MRETKIHALVASISTVIFWGWPFYHLYGHDQVRWLQYETREYLHDLLWVVATVLVTFLVFTQLGRRLSPVANRRMHLWALLLASLQCARFLIGHLVEVESLSPGAWLALRSTPLLVAAGILLSWVVWRWPSEDLRRAILALLGCIALVFLLNWRPHGFYENHVRRDRVAGNAGDPTIHLIIFDGLSYDVLFDRGKVVADYPVFAALAQRSHVFHQAWAPGETTAISVPAMLTGRRGVEFENSLFCSLADRFNVFITGSYFPYCQMAECYHSCDTQTLVLKSIFLQALPKRYVDASLWTIARDQEEMLLESLAAAVPGSGSFYFSHFVLPHFPYVLDREGLREQYTLGTQSMTAYREQVAYVDALLGRVLASMEAHGQLEGSLLIVTSDHANRAVKGTPRRLRVPLFVNLPGQEEGHHYRMPVHTIGIKALVESFIEGDSMFLAHLECSDCPEPLRSVTEGHEEPPAEASR